MLKLEECSGGGGGAWAPTLCESCRSAPCTVYCRADAAALCAACDANIHSANLLARRHHRVPILPALARGGAAGLVVRPSLNLPYHMGVPVDGGERGGVSVGEEEDQEEQEEDDDGAAASWMLLNPLKGNNIQSCHSLLFGDEEGDEFLDLDDYNNNSSNNNNSSENPSAEDGDGHNDQDVQRSHGGRSDVGSEFLVPNEQHSQQHQQGYNMMDQFDSPHGFGYSSSSLNHSASFSSMDASLVPDATCMDISNADQFVRPSKGTIDLFSGHPFLQFPSGQFNPMDREARVLRYREKRKNRKFEKTIRYASRKAYAETRPRIKGRFAKRSDLEVEVDQMFSTSVLVDSTYGIVPSF